MRSTRRDWLRRTAIGAAALGGLTHVGAAPAPKRGFKLSLRCHSVGIRADQRRAIDLAHRQGFESVTPDARHIAGLSETEAKELKAELDEKGLTWGATDFPVAFRRDDASFRTSLERLPKICASLAHAGVTRLGTAIFPANRTLTYRQNFRLHVRRLRESAKVLADHGQRAGFEYIGPKTLWASSRHTFIHTLAETRELLAEIGEENVGVILDSWHWYTAHEDAEDLRALTNDDVVACDLNDAPAGVEIDRQIDSRRELPTATGVIDIRAFLGELVRMKYDGPVRAEPFNKTLNELGDEEAAAATVTAMKKAFARIAT